MGASRRHYRVLTEHHGDRDLPPAVDPAQLDLAAGHEAEKQNDRRVLARQRALRLHAAAKLFVKPLNHARGSQCFPLRLGDRKRREQLITAFPQTRYDPGAALGPCALESRVSGASGVAIRNVNDAMKVVPDLSERVLWRFSLKVAELVVASFTSGIRRW